MRVPAQVSVVTQRVPRTVATEPRPRVWNLPWSSEPQSERAGGFFLVLVLAARAFAVRATGQAPKFAPRRTSCVRPLFVAAWRTSNSAPQKRAVCVVP